MIDYQVFIDFQHPEMIRVPVVQGDTESRRITFVMFNGAADYNPQTDLDTVLTVALSYLKPDGTGGQYDTMPDGETPAGSLSGNVCVLRLAPQTMSAAGLVLCNLVLFNTQGVTLQTFPFVLDVKRSAGMEITSQDYYNVQTIEGVSQALLNLMELRLARADVPSMADTSGEIPLSAMWPGSAVKAGDVVLGQNYYIAVVASVSGQTVALNGTGMVFTPTGMVKSVNNATPDAAGNVQLLPWQIQYSNTIGGQQVADVEEALDALARSSGLTPEIKTALLNCFAHVAWADEHGQDYYDALDNALNPPAQLSSISAVFNQGSAIIYDTDSLDTLRQYLIVTAHYSDSTTQTVTAYTLSGTLTEGTSTITVSYGGKTTTFNVDVTESQNYVVVGNPVFDGTWLIPASSNGGFIKTPQAFDPQSNTWTIRTEIETPASSTGSQDVIGSVDANNASARAVLAEINNGLYFPYLSSNGSAWDISTPGGGAGIALNASTVYLFEMYFDGTKYGVRASTDNGATWSKNWSKSSTTPIYGQYAVGFGVVRNAVFNGKVNLAKTEIYVNDQLWWSAM